MKKLRIFLHINRTQLLVFATGCFVGFVYWFFFGCYYGTYPLSSEWWVNSIYGGLIANILVEIFGEIFHPARRKAG